MSVQFEYFYGSQAEQFSFYRIPKPEWENPFTDVKEDDWFYEDIEYTVKMVCSMA